MHSEFYSLAEQCAAAELAASDDAGVVAALNAKSRRHVDTTLRSARWLIVTFGAESAGLILGTLKAVAASNPVVDAGYLSLNSDGLDLSHTTTQQLIDVLAGVGNWPAELTSALKAKGVWYTSAAGDAFGRDITAQDVADCRQWHGLNRRVVAAYNAVVAAIDSGEVTDFDGAVAVFQATE